MPRVAAQITVPGRASQAEDLWYDTSRWPTWIDGFGHIDKQEGDWPHPGARIIWRSRPGGRGRVVEQVDRYEARTGQTVNVEDEQLRGSQTISFTPDGDEVRIELAMNYEVKDRSPFAVLAGLLFIRRNIRESLRRTLIRFAHELRDERSQIG